MPRKNPLPDLLGLIEVAELLAVQVPTAYRWRSRGLLPPSEYLLSGSPIWLRSTIEEWARTTGRWPADPEASPAA